MLREKILFHSIYSAHEEVSHSRPVYTFFHARFQDFDPEAARGGPSRGSGGGPNEGVGDEHPSLFMDARYFPVEEPRLLLRLFLDPVIPELRIFVAHARQLPVVGEQRDPPSTYVKVYLIPPQLHNRKLPKALKRKTRGFYRFKKI